MNIQHIIVYGTLATYSMHLYANHEFNFFMCLMELQGRRIFKKYQSVQKEYWNQRKTSNNINPGVIHFFPFNRFLLHKKLSIERKTQQLIGLSWCILCEVNITTNINDFCSYIFSHVRYRSLLEAQHFRTHIWKKTRYGYRPTFAD